MTQRSYRGNGCLQERLSDEICRRRAVDRDIRSRNDDQRRRAQNLAGTAINAMADHSASQFDQAARKRDLLDGPEEFRAFRADR
ncbi:hypothetical protein ACVIHI_000723 [Bradyrhizobium sp. USDA 4524]|uniref:hypothetical protein n=1 Tax=unclassified Bradyrhizobium TaxID=2631580 RepID=UPI00209F419D|nr:MULTISPECIES: hypothetical protein [unclassified Bradyrhizobium]MCP1837904.1 hypothetical protein [Bradyrhizobium sp. USDA 4538]MCP1898469.1 hypothetical protein [Bradyrhizobium sp. USDA 4537]MCP1987421.1 hypothetical protein [Bradyrhizobium sp. USDA 4539]